ncbi:MAG: DUF896 domain-containing protein [Mycoplasmatales bacterium]
MAIDQKLIKRINELAKKKKNQGLTKQEQEEQKTLREQYLKAFRVNVESTLNNVDIVDKLELKLVDYQLEDINSKLAEVQAIKSINKVADKVEILYDYKKIAKEEILKKLKR